MTKLPTGSSATTNAESTPGAAEVQTVVVQALGRILGIEGDLPLSTELRGELSMDSILVVTVLLELEAHLDLDLQSATFQLADLRTVQDLVLLARTLSPGRG